MRKLKLQMQVTLDGFSAGPKGELDWMTSNWDNGIINYVNNLTDSVDTILMGRKMTGGFVSYWTDVLKNPENPEYEFAKKMVHTPKIVFTKTLTESKWENTKLARKDFIEEINQLKKQDGKDIIVYGGVTFVSSLVKNNLIDEYHLFINPVVIGNGMSIFDDVKKQRFNLVNTKQFSCGIALINYIPVRD